MPRGLQSPREETVAKAEGSASRLGGHRLAQELGAPEGRAGAAYTTPTTSPYTREQLKTAQEPGHSAVPENPACLAQLANPLQRRSTGHCPGPAGEEAWVGT